MTYPGGTASITNQYDALNRLTNRLDGLGQTKYTYAVLGNGLRTYTEDGPWANDEVTVTNRYGLRAGLRLAQPSGGGFGFVAPLRVWRNYTWYDGLLLVQERSSVNTPTVTYTRGRDLSGTLTGAGGIGGLLARSHGYSGGNWSSHNFYHADGNGNVTALVNSAGTLQASYRYDPFGRYLNGGGPLTSANVLRFSSKPWVAFAGSTTSSLYSYGYRFYDPYLQRWPNRDPLGDEAFFTLYAAGKSRSERKLLRRESLKPLYVFVENDSINHTDALGLKIDAAWCQQWLNDCTRDNLLNLKSCLGCMGPSVGAGVATCAIGCLKWASGGWVTYGTCFVACSGVDAVVFMVGSSWCRDAFADGMKGCKEGYERCMDRVSE